jgi:quinol monooxygenase YgiN
LKPLFLLTICLVMIASPPPCAAQLLGPITPSADEPIYVVRYIDVLPAKTKVAIAAVKQVRDVCRRDPGNVRCEIAERLEQPNQFVVIEIWKDQKALDAYGTNTAATAAYDKIKPMLESPYDIRIHRGLSIASPLSPPNNGRMIFVVTHVDVILPRAGEGITLLTRMAEARRSDPGSGRLEVLQQLNRPNHFSVVEIWPSRRVFEDHATSPAIIAFRNELQPLAGALYDQRLYKVPD